MGRIRTIKPEFPQSESMGRISREARLCFILLWTLVDDSGRTRASSRMLASLLYPYDDDAPKLLPKWLAELEKEECLDRYEVEGNSYLEIRKWKNHQKIDKPSQSKIPAFDESSRILAEDSATDQGPRTKEGTKDHTALIERVFDFYCKKAKREPSKYSLTDARKKKAESRIEERLKIHKGDIEIVTTELRSAIENLTASEFHRTKGFMDWTDHVFVSAEMFEKRLAMTTQNGSSQIIYTVPE